MQSSHEISAQVRVVLQDHPDLLSRFLTLQRLAVSVRPSEFHVTNACNIRCDGCWFFAFGHDKTSNEVKDVDRLNNVIEEIRARKRINAALLIGGEPTLFPDRLQVFRSKFRYLTISTNGLRQLPKEGFEDVAVGITLFGGGPLDDQLRGIKPGGQRFTGLLQTALANYRDDPRAGFIFALTEPGVGYIEDTVRRIQDNGNRVQFSYYSNYGGQGGTVDSDAERLLDEALRVSLDYGKKPFRRLWI
jgi:sulfatase maturation enzyme AslB (radical SAM superfamily)